MNYPRKWEIVSENTLRLRVPQGWLIREIATIISGDKACSVSVALIFIEDSEHIWNLEEK